jgi:hypothetical protein
VNRRRARTAGRLLNDRQAVAEQDRRTCFKRDGEPRSGNQGKPFRLHAGAGTQAAGDLCAPANDCGDFHTGGQWSQPAVEVDLHAER